MLFSFLFVELAFVPVRPEQQARNPGRRPAHLIADRLQGYIGAALDDEFVMDAPHDETVPEGLHGVCQNVPGHGLHKVFRDLRPVGFQPGPLPQVDAFVGHALGAETVHADPGFDVGEPPARGRVDKQHPALVVETKAV